MAELAGAEVSWDAEARQVHFRDEELEMTFTVGSDMLQVNDEAMSLQRAVTIVDDRTMVPSEVMRLFAQHFALLDLLFSLVKFFIPVLVGLGHVLFITYKFHMQLFNCFFAYPTFCSHFPSGFSQRLVKHAYVLS